MTVRALFQQRAELDREEFLSRQASPKRGGIAETAAPRAHGDAIRALASRGGCGGDGLARAVVCLVRRDLSGSVAAS